MTEVVVALIITGIFGTMLTIGLRSGTMPTKYSAFAPGREASPAAFWAVVAAYGLLMLLGVAATLKAAGL